MGLAGDIGDPRKLRLPRGGLCVHGMEWGGCPSGM